MESSKEAGALAGVKLSLSEDIHEQARLVKEGKAFNSENRYFRMAATEAFGRAYAGKYDSWLTAELAKDPRMKASTDVADFDQWEQGKREEWYGNPEEGPAGSSNAALEKGFLAAAVGYVQNQRTRFANEANTKLEGAVNELFYQDVQRIKELALPDATPEDIGRVIGILQRGQFILSPKDGPLLNRTTVAAIVDLAVAEEDEEILEILMHVPGGPRGSVLGKTRMAREEVEKAKTKIYQAQMRSNTVTRQREDREHQDRGQAAFVSLHGDLSALLKDGGVRAVQKYDLNAAIDELVANGGDRQQVSILEGSYKAFLNRSLQDDPDVVQGLWLKVMAGKLTGPELADAYASQSVSQESMESLFARLEAQSRGEGMDELVNNTLLQRHIRTVQRTIINSYGAEHPELVGIKDREAAIKLTNALFLWAQSEEGQRALRMEDGGRALDAFLVEQGDAALRDLAADIETTTAELGSRRALRLGETAADNPPTWTEVVSSTNEDLANLESALDAGGALPKALLELLYDQTPRVDGAEPKAVRRFIREQRRLLDKDNQ
jgi:hypothetical protein